MISRAHIPLSVLIVDDDPVFGKILSSLAGEYGVTATVMHSPKQLHSDLAAKYDVAILDYELENITGLQLVATLERLGELPPSILVSSHHFSDDKEWPASIQRVLHKGLGPRHLLEQAISLGERASKRAKRDESRSVGTVTPSRPAPSRKTRPVLVIDDDPMILRLVERTLGIPCTGLTSPAGLEALLKGSEPLGIFLDIHLGTEGSGIDLIPRLREAWPFCPLIVMTADPTEAAVVDALDGGADDFVRKPLAPTELKARLQVRLEGQAQRESKETLRIADICLDRARHSLRGNHRERYLTPLVARLLAALIESKGLPLSRQMLKRKVWGRLSITDNALDRHLSELRSALEEISGSVRVKNIYARGFTLVVGAAAPEE